MSPLSARCGRCVLYQGTKRAIASARSGVAAVVVAVRTLALDRADEALGPAIGPGMPRPRTGVADPSGAAGVAEGEALVRRAVVAEHPLDAQSLPREEDQRAIQERCGVAAAQGRAELAEHQTAGHVDGHVQVTPAHVVVALGVVHQPDAPAAALQAAEALDVHAHELARSQWREGPEAAPRLGKEMAEAVRAVPAQDAMHRARLQPEGRADAVRAVFGVQAQCQHVRLEGVGRAPWGAVRTTRAIGEVGCAMAPAIDRAPTHTAVACRATHSDAGGLVDEERPGPWVDSIPLVQRRPSG